MKLAYHRSICGVVTALLFAVLLGMATVRADDTQRRALDAQARELQESIRLLENERNRLGYSGDDFRKRNQINDLLSRKRDELRAVESLRSSLVGRPNESTVERNQRQLRETENRTIREEIEALEQERNRLGHTGDDFRRRQQINDLISRKRDTLRSGEAQRISPPGASSQERTQRQTLDAEIRELNEEIRILENERNRLGYTGEDFRRRNAINDLLTRKRDLLRAKERER